MSLLSSSSSSDLVAAAADASGLVENWNRPCVWEKVGDWWLLVQLCDDFKRMRWGIVVMVWIERVWGRRTARTVQNLARSDVDMVGVRWKKVG